MKKSVIGIVVVAILVIGGFLIFKPKQAVPLAPETEEVCGLGEGCSISDKRVIGYQVGNQLPNLELQTFDGQTTNLYDALEGKDKFILSLAVDWCSDCERQDEKLDQYYSKLPDNYGAAVVFVDYTSSDGTKTTNKEQALEYIEDKQYSFPYYWDEGNKIAEKFGGVLATPTNIVLDENAIIKAKTEEIDMDILFSTNDSTYEPAILEERK